METNETSAAEVETLCVCMIKSKVGSNFRLYTESGRPNVPVLRTKREFLDHEISRYLKASESEKLECAILVKISLEHFVADNETRGLDSKLAAMLGWNYAEAARMVEQDGNVLLVTAHPRHPSKPFAISRVQNDDDYAMTLVETLLSVRGGQIVIEVYDENKHIPLVENRKAE